MTIALTTSFDPGDYDTVVSYGEVELSEINVDILRKEIELVFEWGNTVTGEWVSGRKRGIARVTVDQWAEVVNVVVLNGEHVGPAIKRAAYQYLINHGYVVGTAS